MKKSKFKVGDQVKFFQWELWVDKIAIPKEDFEKRYSYTKTYTISFVNSGGRFYIDPIEYVHGTDHAYVVNDTLPDELFEL